MSSSSETQSPLAAAAAAFERELARYEKLSVELSRTEVRSQKTLTRTQHLLSESADCEEQLGARLRALLGAMNGARETQQTCMERTLEAARTLQRRADAFAALLARVSALGARARETSEPAIEALAESSTGKSGRALLGSLEVLGDRMAGIIAEADQIVKDADDGDWPDIARDVRSLKQQVQAAHARVASACAKVGGQMLS